MKLGTITNLAADRMSLPVKQEGEPSPPVDAFTPSRPGDRDLMNMKELSAQNIRDTGALFFSRDTEKKVEHLKNLFRGLSREENKCEVLFVEKDGTAGKNSAYDRNNGILYTAIGPTLWKYLIAFNGDGSVRWIFSEESMRGKPVLDKEGNVYIRSDNNIHKLNREGEKIWSFPTTEGAINDMPPVIGPEGTVFFVEKTKDGCGAYTSLHAVKDGKESWSRVLRFATWQKGGLFLGSEGTLYMTTDKSCRKRSVRGLLLGDREERGFVVALDSRNGKEKGQKKLDTWGTIAPCFSEGPDGTVHVKHDDNTSISAFTPEMKLKWTYSLPPGSGWLDKAPCFDGDGSAYISTNGSNEKRSLIARLGQDGSEIWKKEIPGESTGSHLAASGGKVYVARRDDTPLSFNVDGREGDSLPEGGLLKSMEQGSASRTSESQLHVNGEGDVILFKPDFKEIFKNIDARVLTSLVRENRNESQGKVVDADDFISIGGIKLEKNAAMSLIR